VGKGSFNFIVFTPQPRWYPSTNSINACIEYAKTHYRVDPSRIYVSGLSMGGILACDLASEIPNSIAAIVPMAGVSRDYDVKAKCKQIAGANLPVWAFHCADDNLFDFSFARKFVDDINSFNPRIKAKLTVWPNGGHDAWTRASEPDYRENGMNIYEWMLQYRR
jgi:predicted peptidase